MSGAPAVRYPASSISRSRSCSRSARRSCDRQGRIQQPPLGLDDARLQTLARRPRHRGRGPAALRQAGASEVLEQDPRAQALSDFECLRQMRRARVQQPSGQPVVVASPVTEQRGASGVVLLTRPEPLDGVERLQRCGHGIAFVHGLPRQPQAAPATRTRATARPGTRRAPPWRHGSFDRRACGSRAALEQRRRPQAGGAQLRVTERASRAPGIASRCPAAAAGSDVRVRSASTRWVSATSAGRSRRCTSASTAVASAVSRARAPLRSAAARSASGAR